MKYAWIEENIVRNVAPSNPRDIYYHTIAALYDTEVPDSTVSGATLVDGVWTNPPPSPLPTVAELADIEEVALEAMRASVSAVIQAMMNDSSKSRGYGDPLFNYNDALLSECSYATSTGTFGTEAQITVNWRDAVWTYAYSVQADVIAESRTAPTLDELLAELPTR